MPDKQWKRQCYFYTLSQKVSQLDMLLFKKSLTFNGLPTPQWRLTIIIGKASGFNIHASNRGICGSDEWKSVFSSQFNCSLSPPGRISTAAVLFQQFIEFPNAYMYHFLSKLQDIWPVFRATSSGQDIFSANKCLKLAKTCHCTLDKRKRAKASKGESTNECWYLTKNGADRRWQTNTTKILRIIAS